MRFIFRRSDAETRTLVWAITSSHAFSSSGRGSPRYGFEVPIVPWKVFLSYCAAASAGAEGC